MHASRLLLLRRRLLRLRPTVRGCVVCMLVRWGGGLHRSAQRGLKRTHHAQHN